MEANELYTVMLQAHLEDMDKKYSQDIKTYPEPGLMLANDRQVNGLARFCCDPFKFCVITVDPTFCLGDFDVTPTSYHHLLLESVRTGKPPVIIGPTLLQYKRVISDIPVFCIIIGWTEERVGSMPLELMAKKPSLMPCPTSFAHLHPQNAYYITNTIHRLIPTIWYRPFCFSY